MAHFAKLGKGNVIEAVHVVNNKVITDKDGKEQEQLGIDFLNSLHKTNAVWKQTSYNRKIRKNYAGVGYTYDEARDAFIAPKPYNSWVLDEKTCIWKAPKDYPDDGKRYYWDEPKKDWVEE